MQQLKACRGCLDSELTLHKISDKYLQETFENLTKISLQTQKLPVYFCTECTHRLRYCGNFRSKCVRAEAVFMHLLQNNAEQTQESTKMLDRKSLNLQTVLSTSHAHSIDIPPQPYIQTDIKEETDLKMESIKENSIIENIVNKTEDMETNDVFDDGDHYSSLGNDDDDDVPLINMVKDHNKVKKAKVKRSKKGFNETYAKEILLTKEQQISELRGRQTSQNYLHSPYRCELCYKGFVEEVAFRNHNEKHDKKSGQYSCEICQLRYPSRRQLLGHEVTAHRRRYQCAECKHMSQTANQAREHERWHRGHKYECRQCGLTFDKPTSHLTHIRKAHRSLFACAACGESCVSEHGLRMHRAKTRHDDIVEEVSEPASERCCVECGVQFLRRAAYIRHILTAVHHKTVHKTAKNCVICKIEFTTNTELQAHVREHRRQVKPPQDKERPLVKFHCDLCTSTFVNKSKLGAHYRRAHLGIRPERDFVCEVCGKHFKSNATLKYHHRSHSGERPWPCSHPACPRRFRDPNQLRIHARVHSGARPYRCALCARAFRQKPALNRHMRVHTGAKPYACTYCPKAFSQSNSLKLHTRTVHHKLPSNRKRNKTTQPTPAPALAQATDI